MRTSVITTFDELDTIWTDWQRLANEAEFPSVCANPLFIRAWWRAFGQRLLLRVVVITDGAHVRLIAPFYTTTQDRQLRLIGDFWGDYNSIVFNRGDHECTAEFMRFLHSRRDWNKLVLGNLPSDSLLLEQFQSAQQSWSPLLRRLSSWSSTSHSPAYLDVSEHFPYLDLAARREFKDLLESDSYSKHIRWFARKGKLTYQCSTNRETCLSILSDYFEMHHKEWHSKREKGDDSESVAKLSRWFQPVEVASSSPLPLLPNRKFFQYLVDELCPYGMARCDVLALDDRPFAIHFGMTQYGRLHFYKGAYDPEFRQHKPGLMLIAHVLKQAIESGVKELDWGCGLHQHKLPFTSDIRRTGTLTLYRTVNDAAMEEFETLKRRVRRHWQACTSNDANTGFANQHS